MSVTGVSCMQKLQSLRQSSDQDRSKLEKRFKDRLKEMDVKMKDLHRKEKQFCQLERLKARSEETCARLNSDILSIKQQKVGLGALVEDRSAQATLQSDVANVKSTKDH